METAQVSVIVPMYNKANYISETIASVRGQTVNDWQLIVVDNLSTDEGPSIVQSLADPRVQLISCNRPGVSAARNTGLEMATGEWIVFLDADDLLTPNYIERQLETAQAADADLVVCCYEEFTDGTPGSGTVKTPVRGAFSVDKLRDSSIVFCPGPQHLFLVNRRLVGGGLRWSESLDKLLGEDTCFWFQAITRAQVAYNPIVLARYRIWAPRSRFTNLSDSEQLFLGIGAAIKENLAFLQAEGRKLTSGQAEMLMRFNYEVFLRAKAAGKKDVAQAAMAEAKKWLKYYFTITKRPIISVIVRRLLGLSLFAALFNRGYRGQP